MHRPCKGKEREGSLDPISPHTVRWGLSCRQFSRIAPLFVSLLLTLLANFGGATRAEALSVKEGSGIFAVPLEQLLEIDVSLENRLPRTRDGLFHITPNALPRSLRNHPQQAGSVSDGSPLSAVSLEIPIFINGEYFGTAASLREARRVIRKAFSTASRIEIYRGRQFTHWYENGRYRLLLDIRIDELTKRTEVPR